MAHVAASRAALLVIDVQQGFDDPSWGRRNNPRLEAQVADLLAAWRACRRPVLHARHMSVWPKSPLRPGQAGNDFKPEAAPRAGEPVFEKRAHSCFIDTPLDEELRRRGIGGLVLAGLTTSHCVSTTARMAADLGYAVWVVSDATATFDRKGHDGTHYPAGLVHALALSDLHGEFAEVTETQVLIAEVGKRGDA